MIGKANFPRLRLIDVNSNNIVEFKRMRNLSSKRIARFNLDANKISDVNEIVSGLNANNTKITLLCNKRIIKVMGQPIVRRRKKAHVIHVPFLNIKYC